MYLFGPADTIEKEFIEKSRNSSKTFIFILNFFLFFD